MLQPYIESLVCCVAHGSKRVVSTLVFPRQKELLCGIRMSGLVIQSFFSQENLASASLSWSRLLCVKEDGEGEKETTFIGEVMQRISSNLQFDLQGRQWVPGVGLWRENRAQAWGSLLWLPLVKLFFIEKRTLSPTEKGVRMWGEHCGHCRDFLHLKTPCFAHTHRNTGQIQVKTWKCSLTNKISSLCLSLSPFLPFSESLVITCSRWKISHSGRNTFTPPSGNMSQGGWVHFQTYSVLTSGLGSHINVISGFLWKLHSSWKQFHTHSSMGSSH